MPPDRFAALRAALPGATPGPWGPSYAYRAAADPSTVRALLDERDALRALVEKVNRRTKLRSGGPSPNYAALVHIDHLTADALREDAS